MGTVGCGPEELAIPAQSHLHHYVPQWYQRRFLRPGKGTYHYLDLRPETIVSGSKTYKRRSVLPWGPGRCFCINDLYTVKLGSWVTDDIERTFFGEADTVGKKAVEAFAEYFQTSRDLATNLDLIRYMGAQRFRTPRGLDQIKAMVAAVHRNEALLAMSSLFEYYSTMWGEGTLEIVRATRSPTRFIVSDEPVTFFNRHIFPSESIYPGEIELDKIGTRTLFPLGPDSCLIITHTQLTRDPWSDPKAIRVNARSYQRTMVDLTKIQFGRELEEDEVLRVNLILKSRATRYIAASEPDWLYPERYVFTTDWAKLDQDWFLFPHLYKIPFVGEFVVGYKDGSSWRQDEYGRRPIDPHYRDPRRHRKEWETHLRAQEEWARRRKGRSVAHVDNFAGLDVASDLTMQRFLESLDGSVKL